jgi:hypothetical protein
MIVTKPRDWARIRANLAEIEAKRVFIMGCGECATMSHTGGEAEVLGAKARLEQEGYTVSGWAVSDVTCNAGGVRLDMRKHYGAVGDSDAVLVLSCGAGVQTVADSVDKPVFPGLESSFLGNIVRHGIFEERCQMCGDCVLDKTAGICPVTTCPKGLLNGPCGGMWNGKCEVLTDRACTHVVIRERLAAQGRTAQRAIAPKDFSAKRGPGAVNVRDKMKRGKAGANDAADSQDHGTGDERR